MADEIDILKTINSARFIGVEGVGDIQLNLEEDQRVYALIGTNGVGKTRCLELIFKILFYANSEVRKTMKEDWHQTIPDSRGTLFLNRTVYSKRIKILEKIISKNKEYTFGTDDTTPKSLDLLGIEHTFPVVFLNAEERGLIFHEEDVNSVRRKYKEITTAVTMAKTRRESYIKKVLIHSQYDYFSAVEEGINVEKWFVAIAHSDNPYQKSEDNRGIEIETVLKLMHQLDVRIDEKFLQIDGNNQVFIKINGEERELSHLSSGFTSVLKLIQGIVSGYGYFTNAENLEQVRGVVLIDEIESHLHVEWQSTILVKLKELFPNTTFYVATHSPIVLTQLEDGEVYRLERNTEGIVTTEKMKGTSTALLVDLINTIFSVNLNQHKRDRMSPERQKRVKERLLSLIEQGLDETSEEKAA